MLAAAAPVPVESLAADVRGAEALRAQAASGDPESLRSAARQFEAMFIQIMLKTMRDTRFSTQDDPFANSPSLKLYQELLDQQWAQRMSDGRGLGFAEAMYQAMSRPQATPEALEALTPGHPLPGRPGAVPLDAQVPTGSIQAEVKPAQTAAPEPGSVSPGSDRQTFIDNLLPQARKAAEMLGVPAEYIVAQAALETGWGRKPLLTDTGADSHNLFGIKAGASWTGAGVEHMTTEYQYGLPVKQTERFRDYDSHEAAFMDYAQLLKRRYPLAVGAESPDAFASGLVAGGYATDPAYGQKLQRVIARLG